LTSKSKSELVTRKIAKILDKTNSKIDSNNDVKFSNILNVTKGIGNDGLEIIAEELRIKESKSMEIYKLAKRGIVDINPLLFASFNGINAISNWLTDDFNNMSLNDTIKKVSDNTFASIDVLQKTDENQSRKISSTIVDKLKENKKDNCCCPLTR